MDKLRNQIRDALDLVERIEMLGTAPPVGLDLEAREFATRRRTLVTQLCTMLGRAMLQALKQ